MRWVQFVRRKHFDDEIARDLAFYIEAETEDNMARGMSRLEARSAALRKLGNPTLIREDVYQMNTAGMVESLWQDLRYAFRGLRQSPGFTAAAVLSLALGIGGNTAVFTAVRGVLLKPLPYAEPGRLVKVAESAPDTPVPETIDFTTAYDLRARSRSFASLSLYRDAAGAMVQNGQPELLNGLRVNYDYFDTLGVKMELGRAFLAEEDRPDRRYEVILTHGLWMRQFGGDPGVLGRTLRLSDASFTVVGVLPAGFHPIQPSYDVMPAEIFLPLGYALDQPSACRGCQHLQLIGRLKRGVSIEQARQELSSLMRDIAREHPKDYARNAGVRLTPLLFYFVGRVSTAMWVLLGAVGFVLLIACANVANLMLARGTARSKEMALRAALGAARARLVRQLILESVLLAGASGLAGLLLAGLATSALVGFAARQIPRIAEIRIDAPVLWFTLATSLLTVVVAGTIPALRASRVDLAGTLRAAGANGGQGRHRLRSMLVTAEIALAFLLVMGAGLLARSFARLTGVDPGYDPHNVLTMGVYVYGDRYKKPEAELEYYRQVMERLRAIPGVESAGMTSLVPLGSFDRRGFHIQDRPLANTSDAPGADTYSVSPDYFRVMRIPLKRGRL
ncbi:MAG TPA: ABC transporter permease, partial [Candidatus Sulfopaludibacter sp.]|nr:ABC transporter permease [Candidatus Sulfopaludibacter sp.]